MRSLSNREEFIKQEGVYQTGRSLENEEFIKQGGV